MKPWTREYPALLPCAHGWPTRHSHGACLYQKSTGPWGLGIGNCEMGLVESAATLSVCFRLWAASPCAIEVRRDHPACSPPQTARRRFRSSAVALRPENQAIASSAALPPAAVVFTSMALIRQSRRSAARWDRLWRTAHGMNRQAGRLASTRGAAGSSAGQR